MYAIDTRFVDPRRPRKTKLSAEEQEERLIPYADTLQVSTLFFITFDKQVCVFMCVRACMLKCAWLPVSFLLAHLTSD